MNTINMPSFTLRLPVSIRLKVWSVTRREDIVLELIAEGKQ